MFAKPNAFKTATGYVVICLCVFFSFVISPVNPSKSLHAQEINDPVVFIQEFNRFHEEFPRERIHLQTDRETYYSGDRIWFSVFVTAGSRNLLSGISSVLYVELHSPAGERLDRTLIKVENGRGYGSVTFGELPPEAGTYSINAYTAWSLNFDDAYIFSTPINVLDDGFVVSDPEAGVPASIEARPESGALIAGIPVRLAVSVSDDAMRPVETGLRLTGSDGFGEQVSTGENGTAIIEFTPSFGVDYTVNAGNVSLDLPEVESSGIRFQATSQQGGQIAVDLQSSGVEFDGPLVLAGQVRGRVYYAGELLMQNGRAMNWISPDLLPSGLVQLILIGPEGKPLAERLVYNQNRLDELQVQLSADKDAYGLRDRSMLTLSLKNSRGEAVSGTASLTIYDENWDAPVSGSPDIRGSFWLEAGLPKHAFGGRSLFDLVQSDPEDAEAVLMLADPPYRHDALFDPETLTLFSLPEEGFTIAGTIKTGFRGRPVHEASVMFALGETQDDVFIVDTNEEGRFAMRGLDISGSEVITIRANDSRGRDNVRIELDEQFAHLPNLGSPVVQRVVEQDEEVPAAEQTGPGRGERARRARTDTERFVLAEMEVELDEVVITAEREDREEMVRRMAAGDVGGASIRLEDRPELQTMGIREVITRLPGVQVRGESINIRTGFTTMTAGSEPLLLIDGMAFDLEMLDTISSSDVESVMVLRRPDELARFGATGANGVISIRTHRGGGPERQTRGLLNAFVEGYDDPPPFFTPRYGGAERDREEPDNRITLHWVPKLEIGTGGADVLFWTGDVPGRYRVVIEGLTVEGIPFREVGYIEVEA